MPELLSCSDCSWEIFTVWLHYQRQCSIFWTQISLYNKKNTKCVTAPLNHKRMPIYLVQLLNLQYYQFMVCCKNCCSNKVDTTPLFEQHHSTPELVHLQRALHKKPSHPTELVNIQASYTQNTDTQTQANEQSKTMFLLQSICDSEQCGVHSFSEVSK